MDEAQRLHTFARRTCLLRHGEWSSRYAELPERTGYEYSDAAYSIFPRYIVDDAVLAAIETLDFDRLPPVGTLRPKLIEAALFAGSDSTKPSGNSIHERAMTEEREALADLFSKATSASVANVEPLPYRRVLSQEEFATVCQRLAEVWGATGGYWYPLHSRTHPSLIAFELARIDRPRLEAALDGFLRAAGAARMFEIREWGESYLTEAAAHDFDYTGAEGFFTDPDFRWIVYCSHESTITLGGEIAAVAPPDFERIVDTPFHLPR